jgi:hypothetical protein
MHHIISFAAFAAVLVLMYMPVSAYRASADVYAFQLAYWTGPDGNTETQTAPSCPSGMSLVNWAPVSSYDNWTSVGLCMRDGASSDSYRLTSWAGPDGDPNTLSAPSCPSGMTLVNWVPVSSYDNWTSVGLCMHDDSANTDAYQLTSWTGSDGAVNTLMPPSCPAGMTLINWAPVSSYDNWSSVGLCAKHTSQTLACSISFDKNPVSENEATTIRWTSSGADWLYIDNIGQIPNSALGEGSATVGPFPDDTVFTANAGTNDGDQVACTGDTTLRINADGRPHVSIWADKTTIDIGESVGVHATFEAGPGDLLNGDNIDRPLGSGLGQSTAPDARKDITFVSGTIGVFTFYARAVTAFFPDWTTYATTQVTVRNLCDNGLDQDLYSGCACPTGQSRSANGYSCSCSNGLDTALYGAFACTCPEGQVQHGSMCVSNLCADSEESCADAAQMGYDLPAASVNVHLHASPALVQNGSGTNLFWDVAGVSSCTVVSNDSAIATLSGISSGGGGLLGQSAGPITKRTVFTLSCLPDGLIDPESVTVNLVPKFQEE